jgi:hypothetical protein
MQTNGITIFAVYLVASYGTFVEATEASVMLSGHRRL